MTTNATSEGFWGIERADGRVGVRDHLLVIATCDCAYVEARRIAEAITGAVAVGQWEGCGADPMVVRQLIGVADNPNVGAVLLVGLGCETISVDVLAEGIASSNKPLADVVVQRDGGSLRTIEKGVRILREMAAGLSRQQKSFFGLDRLTVALQCGGSDGTSGIAANPAVGVAVEKLLDAGATVICSEPVEMIGTAHILARRAVNEGVAQDIRRVVSDAIRWARASGHRGRFITKGNLEGGLTTIEEKSLGAILKAGMRPIQGVLENSRERLERPAAPGLYIQDGTGGDIASVTHMVAVGAQLVIFTTGRGSTTGHAVAPVIKVTGNPITYANLVDNMDVNAGRIITGETGIEQLGKEIYALAIAVASGAKTKPEMLHGEDFRVWRRDPVAVNLIAT
jgi:altronate dehydratase large subunit